MHAPGMRVLPSCFSCSFSSAACAAFFPPASRSFSPFVFFFSSHFCLTEPRARARPGNSFTFRSRGDRPSARWLPPPRRVEGPTKRTRTWRDRTSIFHRARLRITCPCAPHANRPFASLPFPLSFNELYVWRLENYIPHDVWILRRAYTVHSLAGAHHK